VCSFSELWARYEFIFYLLFVFLIAAVYMGIKKIKMQSLINNERLTNVKRFRFGVETSMAISEEGLIGLVNFKLETLTINIKDIAEFEIILNKYCITNAKVNKNDGILFSGVSGRIKQILADDKFKEINLILRLKNSRVFGISLFKATRMKRVIETKQDTILQMFDTLEAVERECKGKSTTPQHE